MTNGSSTPGQAAARDAQAVSAARQELKRQFVSFALVGVVGTITHYATMLSLIEFAGATPVMGTFAGFFAGLGASYVLNRQWTFDKRPPWARGFATYFAVCFVGLGINMGIVALALAIHVHFMIGQVVATCVALFWNFLSSKFVVFR